MVETGNRFGTRCVEIKFLVDRISKFMQSELKLQRAVILCGSLVSFLHLIYPQPANYLRTLPLFSKNGTLSGLNGPYLVPTEMSGPGSLVRTASNSAIGINDTRHRRRSRSTSII